MITKEMEERPVSRFHLQTKGNSGLAFLTGRHVHAQWCFSNDCLFWFTNSFSYWVQCVKSEGLPLAVSIGVTQGSILRPTLFSVYINDVALAAGDSLIHLHADDTILYTSDPSLDTVLINKPPNELQCHIHSFRGLQVLWNSSKTKCMLFNLLLPAPARPTSITTLDGSDLEYVANYKYLGVWIDYKTLLPDSH